LPALAAAMQGPRAEKKRSGKRRSNSDKKVSDKVRDSLSSGIGSPTEATHLLSTPALSVCSARSFARDPLATRSIDWISVAFISYFNVCGGPWGSETVISSAGPLPGLVGIVIFAFTSGLPMILVTAELSSMYPDDGGYSIWVAEAFGEFWGFQESYWSWFSGLLDNCLYPVITYRLVEALCFPEGLGFWTAWACKSVMVILFSIPNLLLVNLVGYGLAGMFVIVMLPFFILCLNATLFNRGDPHKLMEHREQQDIDWVHLINILYWNVSGFDCISTCAGEVINPGKSLFRGLVLCLVLVLLTYLLPLSAMASVDQPHWETWKEGDFTVIAAEQVGMWLGAFVAFAGGVGNLGMHVAELFEDSWQLHGMAKCGLAPRIFEYKHAKFHTPVAAVVFSIVMMITLVSLPFEKLMMVDNFFSVASGLLEYAAFLKLRVSRPIAIRPFSIPLGFCGCVVLVLLAASSGMLVLLTSMLKNGAHLLVDSIAVGFGVILYLCIKATSLEYQRQVHTAHEMLGEPEEIDGAACVPNTTATGEARKAPAGILKSIIDPVPGQRSVSNDSSNGMNLQLPGTYGSMTNSAGLPGYHPSSTAATPGTPGYTEDPGDPTSPLLLPQNAPPHVRFRGISGQGERASEVGERALSEILEVRSVEDLHNTYSSPAGHSSAGRSSLLEDMRQDNQRLSKLSKGTKITIERIDEKEGDKEDNI